MRLPAASFFTSLGIRSSSVPLIRCAWCASTPINVAADFGPTGTIPPESRSVLVVSHHLDGLLRAPGSKLVASWYRKGFAAFLSLGHCLPRLATPRGDDPKPPVDPHAFPRRISHPPKKSSLQQHAALLQLVHITVAVAPSSLALVRWAVQDNLTSALLDLEALLRRRVRSDCLPLPVDRRPLLPWALFPSRVLARCRPSDLTRLRISPVHPFLPASARRCRRTVPPALSPAAATGSHRLPRLAVLPSGSGLPVARWTRRFGVCQSSPSAASTRYRPAEATRCRPATADPLGVCDVKELD